MQKKEAIVYIWLPREENPVPCGRLTFYEDGRNSLSRFAYGQKYRARSNAIPLDPIELKLQETEFSTQEYFMLFNAIRDAAPDSWGRYILTRITNQIELDEFEYLVRGSHVYRIGALGFGKDLSGVGGFATANENTIATPSLKDAAKIMATIQKNREIPKDLAQYLLIGSSLGGARPKTTVVYQGGLWIAKFARNDDQFDYTRLEYATMLLAKKIGLNVPPIAFEEVNFRRSNYGVFLIKRFDREKQKSGYYTRRHFISGLTALGAHESDKGRWSYADLSAFIIRFSAQVKNDLLELYKRMIFNICVSNTDDHLRNHGFLYDSKQVLYCLSPLYDVVPSVHEITRERYLFLRISGKSRLANIHSAINAAPNFSLEQKQAEQIVKHLTNEIASSWRKTFHEAGFGKKQIEQLSVHISTNDKLI